MNNNNTGPVASIFKSNTVTLHYVRKVKARFTIISETTTLMDFKIVFVFIREEFSTFKAPVKCNFGALDWALRRRPEHNYNTN